MGTSCERSGVPLSLFGNTCERSGVLLATYGIRITSMSGQGPPRVPSHCKGTPGERSEVPFGTVWEPLASVQGHFHVSGFRVHLALYRTPLRAGRVTLALHGHHPADDLGCPYELFQNVQNCMYQLFYRSCSYYSNT